MMSSSADYISISAFIGSEPRFGDALGSSAIVLLVFVVNSSLSYY